MMVATDYRKSCHTIYYLLVISLTSAFSEIPAASTVHYIIPNEWTDSSNCSDCHTLGEWIENGTSPFTKLNDMYTTVVLLSGLHLINSTICARGLLIENISSLILTGRGEVTVECLCPFTFEFRNIKSVSVSHITFKYCGSTRKFSKVNSTFYVLSSQHLSIQELNIVFGGVVAAISTEWKFTSKFCKLNIINSQLLVVYGPASTSQTIMYGKIAADIFISDSIFQGSNIHMRVSGGLLDIRLVLFEKLASSIPALHTYGFFNATLTNITFQNNSSPLISMNGINSITFKGHCVFNSNIGNIGVFLQTRHLTLSPNTKLTMIFNVIKEVLLHILLYDNATEEKVPSKWLKSVVQIQNNTFKNGVIVNMISDSQIAILHSYVIFENNSGLDTETTAIMLLVDALISVSDSRFKFINNTATHSGGITFMNSKMFTDSSFIADFVNNQGGDGAAMSFYKESFMLLSSFEESVFTFHSNRALKRGGAIFVEDSDYINSLTRQIEKCFILKNYKTRFLFSNNSARLAGNDIYGGWIDFCKYTENYYFSRKINMMWVFSQNDHDLHAITSNPIRICMCQNSIPFCNVTEYKVENKLFPGQTLEIMAVAVGQRMGIVPSVVLAQFSDEEGSLGEGQDVQSVGRQCTKLHFTVFTSQHYKLLELRTQGMAVPQLKEFDLIKYQYLFQQLSVSINMMNCNFGFEFHENLKRCQCSPLILHHDGVDCDFSTWSIKRKEGKWLLTTNEYSSSTPNTGIIIHNHCPYDYCRTDSNSLTFHLETPDDQCAFNRSGVLCGACQANLSQVLGTSKCRECSNIMLIAVIPATVLLGILLVALLMILNLTISTGTINGLIFYSNIIRASQAVFFPPQISSSFFSIFIAWLNLDLGIETCFCDGLDAYTKTWLQFVFPLYIWLMVTTIIVASHYFSTASRLFGNNAVQVLATLFLLSYAKILRVVITVFSSTVLIYPDGFENKVWLLDGNIEFLRGKHIPLFIASLLMFLLLSVPYTLSLVSIQWLQMISHYRVLFWVHRLMPLFDAYTGPYKHKHRYWTGLLLLTRILFILIFSLNISNNPAVNLLAIAVISSTVLAYLCYMRVYKNLLHNILEALSIFNLGLLSVATLYQISNGKNNVLITYISSSVAFIITICITFYHCVERLLSLRIAKLIRSLIDTHMCKKGTNTGHVQPLPKQPEVTHTSVELTELLISQDTEIVNKSS